MNIPVIEALNKRVNNHLKEFKNSYKELDNLLKNKEERLTKLLQVDKNTKLKFNKYYAVLVFDGDDMGKWLSGDCLGEEQKNDKTLKKYHKAVSEILANFAEKARKYIDENRFGKTIYAGGDDFLALLNLENIFDTLAELRKMFDTEVNQKLKEKFSILNGEADLTFSAGLTIAHYKEPLGEVLNRVRSMEQKAKQVSSKNALAISVMKHSGEMQEAVLKWGESVSNLAAVLKALIDKQFSPAFIENMNRAFFIFDEEQKKEIDNLSAIFETETKRLVKRAFIGDKEIKNEQVNEISKKVYDLYSSSEIEDLGIYNFIEILNIIDFIYRKA